MENGLNCNKICTKCGIEKSLDEFNWSDKKKNKKHSYCKECAHKYTKNHYNNNKDYYKGKANYYNRKNDKEIRKLIFNYLLAHPCVDCGESDIRVLDFDHVRGKKEFNVGEAVRKRFSKEKIIKEIEKCDIRCANCHRKKTVEQFGYWSSTARGEFNLEEWKIIEDFPKYAVSNMGRIKRIKPSRKSKEGLILKPFLVKGYECIRLTNNNIAKQMMVHKIVLEAFYGKQENSIGRHKDGVKINNRIDNLKWVVVEKNNVI